MHHFKHRPYLDQALADLDLLVMKPEPPPPNPEPDHPWSDEDWLNWAVDHYLPFRFWLEEIGELSGKIVEYANAYADWLYQRYPAMRLSSPNMVYQALPLMKHYMTEDQPTLIVVIDNFNAKFTYDLIRYMQLEGFYSKETRYFISMLPSCTEISKKSLLLGQPEPFPGTAYGKDVEETWEKALNGRPVRYLPHIGALRAIKDREHDVYFLNYLPIDIAFHQDEEQVGISHAQSARNYLRALAGDIRAFAERIGAEMDLVTIIISDHGSTRIPSSAPNIIDSKFFAGRVKDKHHRYVSISDTELEQLPDNIQSQCYFFERVRFGLEENYLSAREYYRFLPTNVNTYIHGGLSPEETLVPVILLTPLTVSPKPLHIHLRSNEFYYERKSEIQIEIVNTNTYACEHLQIDTRNTNIDAPIISMDRIDPLSQEVINLEGRFRRSFGKNEKLHIQITYNFLEQPQQQEVELDVIIKSMMEQAFDLSELL